MKGELVRRLVALEPAAVAATLPGVICYREGETPEAALARMRATAPPGLRLGEPHDFLAVPEPVSPARWTERAAAWCAEREAQAAAESRRLAPSPPPSLEAKARAERQRRDAAARAMGALIASELGRR